MQSLIEEITIHGEPIHLEHVDARIDQVEPDRDNPRIRYRLGYLSQGDNTLDEVILDMPEVKKLLKDIENNGGLRERVILQQNGKGTYKAVEGNCRLICYRKLSLRHPDDSRWRTIPARVLPKDIDQKKVAILLSDMHIAGKIEWKAHEKAGQVYRMRNDLHMTQDEVAIYLRQSKTTVNRLHDAYAFMIERFLTVDDEEYRDKGEGKWSFFDEFFRSKQLRDWYKADPEFGNKFCRWVGEERLSDGIDVRSLTAIVSNPEALKSFEVGPKKTAFADARKIVETVDPEEGSDFFKLLAKFRDSCTNAAQVKEILRIRTDKVARQRVLDTYVALVDFMRLADVEPPESDNAS